MNCPTRHYDATAGKALPAIPLGIVARVGSAGGQRLGLPLALVRADPAGPSPRAHLRALVRQAVAVCGPQDVLVADREFGVALLQDEKSPAWVVRLVKNFTARRAAPVRPLARSYRGNVIAATPPDREERWAEEGRTVRAQVWSDLVLPDAGPDAAIFMVVAVHDPRYREPLLLATPLTLTPEQVRGVYRDRWPVEQLPLAAKQMIGAARAYVHEPETCQRWPELALLAGAVLSYAAATGPVAATGYWDRQPQRAPGRLRRLPEYREFPAGAALPERVRVKAAVTGHLPKGHWGQQHPRRVSHAPAMPQSQPEVATPAASLRARPPIS